MLSDISTVEKKYSLPPGICRELPAAEITREKVYLRVHEELPYSAAVETTAFDEKPDGSARIEQTIYVERESQRPIVLGKGGQTLKWIGQKSREELIELLDRPVHLFLTVKVDPDGDGVKLLANGVQPIDVVAESAGAQAIRIHLNRSEAVASLAALLAKLEGRTRAEVTLCLPDDQGREIDLTLPDPLPVTPQIKGAIKAMQGRSRERRFIGCTR